MPNTNPNSVSPLRLTQHVLQEFCIEDLSLCVLSLTRASPHPACVLAGGLVSLLACVSFVRTCQAFIPISMASLHPCLYAVPSSPSLCRTFIPASMTCLHLHYASFSSPSPYWTFIPISIPGLHLCISLIQDAGVGSQMHAGPPHACWTTMCMEYRLDSVI